MCRSRKWAWGATHASKIQLETGEDPQDSQKVWPKIRISETVKSGQT